MSELGLTAAEISLDEFGRSDGLLAACFAALPEPERRRLEALAAEVGEDDEGDADDQVGRAASESESADGMESGVVLLEDDDDQVDHVDAPETWPFSVLAETSPWRFTCKATGLPVG
eukprot:3916147-Prorocentrum_lima.AAC.1